MITMQVCKKFGIVKEGNWFPVRYKPMTTPILFSKNKILQFIQYLIQ